MLTLFNAMTRKTSIWATALIKLHFALAKQHASETAT